MAKVEMKASTTFYNEGRFTNAGDLFKIDEADVVAFESRELAKRTDGKNSANGTAFAGEKVYEDMTVTELRVIAKENNVTGYYQMSKAELIEAIRQAEAGAEPAEEGAE